MSFKKKFRKLVERRIKQKENYREDYIWHINMVNDANETDIQPNKHLLHMIDMEIRELKNFLLDER